MVVGTTKLYHHILCRYLDTYEKFYFLGEEEEDESNPYFDEEDSRARKERQRKIVQNVPTSYNEAQHRVADHLRAHYGLSTELYQKTDYDRLGLSLLSPLPNEQDFAINVCTLLSNEGRHTLKLAKCPRLLDILLVSTNIFASLINIFCNVYKYFSARRTPGCSTTTTYDSTWRTTTSPSGTMTRSDSGGTCARRKMFLS